MTLATAQPATPGLFPIRGRWTIALNSALSGAPGFQAARGYFPLEGNRLVAYDFSTGQQLWLIPRQPLWPPLGGDGLVFIVEPSIVAALDERTGHEIWRLDLDGPLAVAPVWDNGWLLVATESGALLAYRARDGELVWRRDAPGRVIAAPALAADRVYVALETGSVLALQITDGTSVWERRLGGAATGLLALDDRVYVGSVDNFLYCLTAPRGEIDWRWRTGGDIVGQPVADRDRVYFVSLDNLLRGLDRGGGSQEWKRALPMRPTSGPLLAADTVIVGGMTASLRAFSARTGAPAGDIVLSAQLAAPAHLLAGDEGPLVVAVTNDIAKGALVAAFSRAKEPPILPLTPLPNPTMPPALPIR